MIGLFFEVQTRPGHRDQYLDLAAALKPALEAGGGCLTIERFQSLSREDLLLSHQIWQDEGRSRHGASTATITRCRRLAASRSLPTIASASPK
jgi:quinol monooxygenase YgiN